MSDEAVKTEQEKPPEEATEGTLSAEDWSGFNDRRQGPESLDFFNVAGQATREKPPDDGGDGGETGDGKPGAQAKKPDEGEEAPDKKQPSGDDTAGAEARKSDEGEGGPTKKQPEGAEEGKLPKGVAARLRRQQERHTKALQEQQQAHEARVAELEAQIKAGGGAKPTPEGGDKPPGDAAAQYQALGIGPYGPDPSDYEDLDAWEHDLLLHAEGKPLEKHPKAGEAGQGGAAKATETETAASEAAKLQEEQNRRRALAWETLDAAFEEADANEESPLTMEDYEAFMDGVGDSSIRCDIEMLEHLAASEEGPAMIKALIDSPVKSKRIILKPSGQRGKALDAMLERVKNPPKGGAGRKETKVLPDLPGGGKGGGGKAKNPDDMNFEEYRRWSESQSGAEQRGDGFLLH